MNWLDHLSNLEFVGFLFLVAAGGLSLSLWLAKRS